MPDFDLEAAMRPPFSKVWSGELNVGLNGNYVTDAWVYYDTPASSEVVLDLKSWVSGWRRAGTRTPEARRRIEQLLDYLNRLSEKNPYKPYYPDYSKLGLWGWVMAVEGSLDDPAVAGL